MEETWTIVPSEYGPYEVSDLGRVRNATTGFVLPQREAEGYMFVKLSPRGVDRTELGYRRVYKRVSHLVLESFVGPRPECTECRHLNDVRADNRLENLCWGARYENIQDAYDNGRLSHVGERNPSAKLTEAQVIEARTLRAAGWSNKALCDRYGIYGGAVGKAVQGINWRHLNSVAPPVV